MKLRFLIAIVAIGNFISIAALAPSHLEEDADAVPSLTFLRGIVDGGETDSESVAISEDVAKCRVEGDECGTHRDRDLVFCSEY